MVRSRNLTDSEIWEFQNRGEVPLGYKLGRGGVLVRDQAAANEENIARAGSEEMEVAQRWNAKTEFARTRSTAPVHPLIAGLVPNVNFYRPVRYRHLPYRTTRSVGNRSSDRSDLWKAFAGRRENQNLSGDELMKFLLWMAMTSEEGYRWGPGSSRSGNLKTHFVLTMWRDLGFNVWDEKVAGDRVISPIQFKRILAEWGGFTYDAPPEPTMGSWEESRDVIAYAPFSPGPEVMEKAQGPVWPVFNVRMALLTPEKLEEYCRRHHLFPYAGVPMVSPEFTPLMEVELNQEVSLM